MLAEEMMSLLKDLVIIFPAFLLVFTVRGFFKALVAKLMGDDTAYQYGFLTLNPLAHIDFYGLMVMLFFLFFIGGLLLDGFSRSFIFIILILLGARWTISVPIDERNFKNYSLGVILTTLAGSFGNFVLALFFLYVLTYFPFALFPKYIFISLLEVFRVIIELAVFFGVLDLIPIPPFDGGRLLQFILPRSWHNFIFWLEEYSLYIFLALFLLPGVSHLFFGFLYTLSLFVKQFLILLVF